MKKIILSLLICFLILPAFAENDFHFAVLSDRSGGVNQEAFEMVVNDIQRMYPDFVVTVGDLSDNALEDQYKIAMKTMEKINVPVYYTPGNNDIVDEESAKLFSKYTGNKKYYSFDYQNTHFVILNNSIAESYEEMSRKQKEWLRDDLEKNKTKENIYVFIHKPFWADNIAKGKKDKMHELFLKYNVDAVFTGHWHQYAHNNYDGIDYYLAGSSGGGFGKENTELGKFYQYLWCRVINDKLYVTIVKAGNTYEDDLVNIQEEQLSFKIDNELIQTSGRYKLSEDNLEAQIKIINETKKDITNEIEIVTDKNWIIEKKVLKANINHGGKFNKTVNFKKNGNIFPLPKLKFVYPFGRGKKIVYNKPFNIQPVIVLNEMEKVPVIDGKIEKNEWDMAQKINQFCDLTGNKSKINNSKIFVSYKNDKFYIGAVFSEPEIRKMKIDGKKRDEQVYRDNSLGLLISQKPDKYYQCYINPNGIVWDALLDMKKGKRIDNWNGSFTIKTKKYSDKWILELSVPFSSFGIDKDDKFFINMARKQPNKNLSGFLTPSWNLNSNGYIEVRTK